MHGDTFSFAGSRTLATELFGVVLIEMKKWASVNDAAGRMP